MAAPVKRRGSRGVWRVAPSGAGNFSVHRGRTRGLGIEHVPDHRDEAIEPERVVCHRPYTHFGCLGSRFGGAARVPAADARRYGAIVNPNFSIR
jgi:hypothetical protein